MTTDVYVTGECFLCHGAILSTEEVFPYVINWGTEVTFQVCEDCHEAGLDRD